ncbi:MAG TPA: hypothetical protein PLM98_02545 [Thiolinea sp.]|nr:hypothetical protein [Thiolinea sp.]
MASVSMRRFWLNTLLLILVGALAGLVWWQFQQKDQQALSKRLLPLTLADVSTILIERQTEGAAADKIELKRKDDQWSLSQPASMDANPIKVRQLLTLLDEQVEASYPSAGKDLKSYGLEPSTVAVSFNGRKLVLGENNPVSNRRYILNGQQIQLVNEAVYSLLNEAWVNFVALKLLPDKLQLKGVQLPPGFADSPELVTNWTNAEAIRVEVLDPKQVLPEMQKVILQGASETKELVVMDLKEEIVLADLSKQLRYILPISQAPQLFPAKTGLEAPPK